MDQRLTSFREAIDARPVSRFHYLLLFLVSLVLAADGYDTQAIGYVAPALAADWGVPRSSFGPVFSAGLFGVMLGALIGTPIADRVGIRRILLVSTGIFGVVTFATAFVDGMSALLAARFIAGLALGAAMPAGIALVSEYAPTRVRAMMVTVAVCGFSVGGALGGVIATTMIEDFGWQSVFLVGGAAPLVLLPLLIWKVPESLPKLLEELAPHRRLHAVLQKVAPGWTPPAAAAGTKAPAIAVAGLLQPELRTSTVLIWTVYFMNLLVLYTLSNWLPTIITESGLPLKAANFATTFYQVGGTVGALLLAWLCDRRSSPVVLSFAFLGAAIAVFLIGAAGTHTGLVIASIAAAGFFVVGGQNATNAFVGNFYPSDMRATGIGWALGIGRLGSILGPLLVGALLAGGIDPPSLLRLCAIPAVIAAIAIFLVSRTRRAAPAAEPATA